MGFREFSSENPLVIGGIVIVLIGVGVGAGLMLSPGTGQDRTAIPAQTDTLVYMNPGIITAESTQTIGNTVINEINPESDLTYMELLNQSSEDGLEKIDQFNSVTIFANSENQSKSGVILRTNIPQDEIIETMQNNFDQTGSIEVANETTYNGKTLYQFEGNSVSQSQSQVAYMGVLGDGVYVVGPEKGVKSSIDTYVGDAEPVDSEFLNQLEDEGEDTYIAFVSTLEGASQTAAESVERISGSYSASNGEQVHVDFSATMTDEQNATTYRTLADQALSRLQSQYGENTSIGRNIQRLSISQDDATINMEYDASAEEVGKLIVAAVRDSGLLSSGFSTTMDG